MTGGITKAELRVLEKMFAKEIACGLSKSRIPPIFQSKAKIMDRLEDKGLVEHIEYTLNDRFQMKIAGWLLTHSGRFTYCANC